MPIVEELLANNERYAAGFGDPLPGAPARHVAVVACMDARLDVLPVLGLHNGDAHVIRNAGGIVTDDTIRSLAISQRFLATTEIVLIHHTECGMLSFTDDEFADSLEHETGVRPPWSPGAFSDLEADLRQSVDRLRSSPFLPHRDAIRGLVFDVRTGRVREVA